MNREEFTKMMVFLTAAIERKPSKETIEVYFEMLQDMPYELALAAAKKVIGEEEYPVLPTVGKIRKAAMALCNMDRVTAPEAWGLVLKAIRSHGFYGEAEAMAELPAEVRTVVKQMGWSEICHSDKPDVLRAQFMRMYETKEAKQKEVDMLPADVKKMVSGLGQRLNLEAGKEQ